MVPILTIGRNHRTEARNHDSLDLFRIILFFFLLLLLLLIEPSIFNERGKTLSTFKRVWRFLVETVPVSQELKILCTQVVGVRGVYRIRGMVSLQCEAVRAKRRSFPPAYALQGVTSVRVTSRQPRGGGASTVGGGTLLHVDRRPPPWHSATPSGPPCFVLS